MSDERSSGFSIRDAVPADAAELAEVHVACWRETYAGLIPQRVLAMLDVDARRHMWRRSIRRGRESTFICTDPGNAIVGFGCSGPVRDVPKSYDGEILAIYLLERAQGLGLGRELMRRLAEALIADGRRSAALRVVRDSDKACGFYRHMGGIEAGAHLHQVDDFKMVTTVIGWDDVSVLL